MFVDIATASIELAKGLVDAGHEDPVAELHRLRSYVQDSWQTALDKKFSSTR
jgi:hypothetical protein